MNVPELTSEEERSHSATVALWIIAAFAVIAALKFGRAVLIPVVLSIALSYSLMPLVSWLQRRLRMPLAVGAALVLAVVVAAVAAGAVALRPQAMTLLDSLPAATASVERMMRHSARDEDSAFSKASEAAQALERVANGPDADPAGAEHNIEVRSYLWAGGAAAMRGIGQFVVIICLVYFLLVSSHAFKRKLVRLSGHTLHRRKLTVQILDEIDHQVQRYLAIQIGTSALVGLLTGWAFAAVGMDNAALWGVMAGFMHLIPYLGPAIFVGAAGLFGWVQYQSLQPVFILTAITLAIAGVIGLIIVPILTERIGRINAVATFIALIFWDWVWGIPGLLLGIPIMMALMAVCERSERLQPVAELLGQHGDTRRVAVEVDVPKLKL